MSNSQISLIVGSIIVSIIIVAITIRENTMKTISSVTNSDKREQQTFTLQQLIDENTKQ